MVEREIFTQRFTGPVGELPGGSLDIVPPDDPRFQQYPKDRETNSLRVSVALKLGGEGASPNLPVDRQVIGGDLTAVVVPHLDHAISALVWGLIHSKTSLLWIPALQSVPNVLDGTAAAVSSLFATVQKRAFPRHFENATCGTATGVWDTWDGLLVD